LARQALQRPDRSMSAPQPSMPHRTTERGVLHAGSPRGPSRLVRSSAFTHRRAGTCRLELPLSRLKLTTFARNAVSSARDPDRSWRHPRDLRRRERPFTPSIWQYQPSRRCGKWYGAYTGVSGISENRGVSQQSRGSRPYAGPEGRACHHVPATSS
jgi:hypothetical protein